MIYAVFYLLIISYVFIGIYVESNEKFKKDE